MTITITITIASVFTMRTRYQPPFPNPVYTNFTSFIHDWSVQSTYPFNYSSIHASTYFTYHLPPAGASAVQCRPVQCRPVQTSPVQSSPVQSSPVSFISFHLILSTPFPSPSFSSSLSPHLSLPLPFDHLSLTTRSNRIKLDGDEYEERKGAESGAENSSIVERLNRFCYALLWFALLCFALIWLYSYLILYTSRFKLYGCWFIYVCVEVYICEIKG